MAQNVEVLLANDDRQHKYTRADFTALRAWLNRLPISQISSLYYCEDDLEDMGCATSAGLQNRLESMRDYLLKRAIDQNPHVAEGLRRARMLHVWSKSACDFLVQAADQDFSTPKKTDPVSVWFRPMIAALIKAEGAKTIGEMIDC